MTVAVLPRSGMMRKYHVPFWRAVEGATLSLTLLASNGKEAIELVETYQPHIVLMDIEMPEMDGLTATRIITEKFIKTSVLIISVHNDDSYLNSALQVGAKGYLKKTLLKKN